MVRFNRIIFFPLFLLFVIQLSAQVLPDVSDHDKLLKGIDHLINHQYDKARNEFNLLNKNGSPLSKIYLAAAEIAEAYDYGTEPDAGLIKNYLTLAVEEANLLLKKDPENVWHHYYLSLAEGYYAYYEAMEGTWLAALSDGLSAISGFEKCLAIDSSFYDAYIAIGTYKYWRSRKTSFLNWLPFVSDEREQGISLLNKSISRNTYNTYLAIHSLLWIYIDRKEFDLTIQLAIKALNKYPDSRVFRWALARAYEETDVDLAIKNYRQILNSFNADKVKNGYQHIVLKHLLAQLYHRKGNTSAALELCNQILAEQNLTKYAADHLKDRLRRVRALKRELSGGN